MMLPLVNTISTILVVSFCAYVLTILVPYLRHKPEAPGNPDRFMWHLFIPCRDEEAVVGTTVMRARERFPAAHVWIIDDDSDDQTAAIVKKLAQSDAMVHLVQRRRPDARIGKGAALNSAYAALNDWLPSDVDRAMVIVCVVDADGEMAANALAAVSAPSVFVDPRVGAAQITVWMKNRNDRNPLPGKSVARNLIARGLIRMQDMEFRTMIAGMQSLRGRTGTVGLGGNGQFTRLSVLDAIETEYGEPWHGSLLEDYELGVHVLLAGYETRHVHDTYVAQEALTSIRRFATQRTRWSQGNIQCATYIKKILQSPNFDSAGVLESCYYLILPFIQLIGFATWVALLAAAITGLTTNPDIFGTIEASPFSTVWGPLLLFTLFGIGPFAVWGPVYTSRCETDKGWVKGVLYGVMMWIYVFYTYVSLTRAFTRIILRRNGWAKTRRNAEISSNGPVALEA